MKKIIILIFIFYAGSSLGCDFCNCYLGLNPGYNNNTIGIRWNYIQTSLQHNSESGLKTMHGGGGMDDMDGETLKQYFNTIDLQARYYPIPKLQLMATIPFVLNTIEFEGANESRQSFSDLTVIAMYQLANTNTIDSTKTRHRVFGGLGIKFPTGKSSGANDIDIPFAHDLYSGTGSTDLLALVSYFGKHNSLGWNVDVNYKLNGESSNDYKYGNTFNSNQRLFYELKFKSSTLLPHLGLAQEISDEDELEGTSVKATGGTIFWGGAGADFYFGQFSITTEARLPITQNIDESMPENKVWFYSSLNFHF